MDDKNKKKAPKKEEPGEDLSRRKAIRKMGYAAFAATTMFLLLNNPTRVHAQSPGPPDDDWEW